MKKMDLKRTQILKCKMCREYVSGIVVSNMLSKQLGPEWRTATIEDNTSNDEGIICETGGKPESEGNTMMAEQATPSTQIWGKIKK